jgi:hypothetical protein
MIEPTLPPVIMNIAITSVYSVIAVWIPVTVVPTSLATVAIDTFMTELSSVITNWPAARVINTTPAAWAAVGTEARSVTGCSYVKPPPRSSGRSAGPSMSRS